MIPSSFASDRLLTSSGFKERQLDTRRGFCVYRPDILAAVASREPHRGMHSLQTLLAAHKNCYLIATFVTRTNKRVDKLF